MAYTTIDNGGEYFNIKTYSGNNVAETKSTEFQVDWLWIKCRNNARSHLMYDSTRGFGNDKHLVPNTTVVEDGDVDGDQVDQGERGFIGSNSASGFYTNSGTHGMQLVNATSNTYVAWYWKCNGGTTTSFIESGNNPGGTIQTNTTAGFSIITTTGTGATGTIAHGLGAVPEIIISKQRSNAENWAIYHGSNTSAPETEILTLNTNDATADNANGYNDTAPTSSVFTVHTKNEVNTDARTYVHYVFAPIQGYSKFGSYTGNGSTDGPFVYTGFKPAWVMIKATASTGGASAWRIADNKRSSSGSNPVEKQLEADTSNAEDSGNDVDLLSNGFKVRSTAAQWNASGVSIIYMAFAESPFVSSEGVPTTAR